MVANVVESFQPEEGIEMDPEPLLHPRRDGLSSAKKKSAFERRYQRVTCDFPAEFSWGTISHSGRARVLGIGGCFLETQVMVPVGEEIELRFQLDPALPLLTGRGKVAWISERGVPIAGPGLHRGFALEFQRIFPEDRAVIDEFVRRKTRVFRAVCHEFGKHKPDTGLIKELFASVCPDESTHLSHIKRVCREELRYFRLRP
jgi:hypothetical protein